MLVTYNLNRTRRLLHPPEELEVQQLHFLTQDDVNTAQTPDQSAHNTRAKQLSRTITQEISLVAKKTLLNVTFAQIEN